MWRYLMRAVRGERGARAWDATQTPSFALIPLLRSDEELAARSRELEERRATARAELAAERAEAAREEREWQQERDRRWSRMTEDERRAIQEAVNVIPWRRKAS